MIEDAIRISEIHLDRLKKALEEIKELGNIESIDLNDFEVIKTVDTFVFRFMKLQDYVGNRLFKAFLITVGDYADTMSFVDVLDKLEKLGIVSSTEEWLKIRKLRNKLAHEYPDELEEIKEDLKEAINYAEVLEQTIERIKNYLKDRNLLF
jgi:hypothetical protein